KTGNVITVTSTNTGEGKTFCAVNLAAVFAVSGKKTALVGFDLRKPRLSEIFDLSLVPGISSYLIGQTRFSSIIMPTKLENLYVLPAGVIPPNPSELISSGKTAELIKKLREQFDVIIIDTPPVGLVSDGRLLMETADSNLFVVRAGVTQKEHLSITMSNLIEDEVKGLAIVLNDVAVSGRRYSYYSSGYFN
ncbi:MAG: CpsD/CapB family tyrosine-protein kinase, partial [Bacteroidales bacterium]|nr:CpsD/CapB family tyrosine-protein kinase [Bacteroidales bacterium]